jgi:hypothetical protein
MMGFFVIGGTLTINGTTVSPVTITSGNDSSPIYVVHQWGNADCGNTGSALTTTGCTGGGNAYVTANYTINCGGGAIKHLGVSETSGYFSGIFQSAQANSGADSITNCQFPDPYIAYTGASDSGLSLTFSHIAITGARGPASLYNIQSTLTSTAVSDTGSTYVEHWLFLSNYDLQSASTINGWYVDSANTIGTQLMWCKSRLNGPLSLISGMVQVVADGTPVSVWSSGSGNALCTTNYTNWIGQGGDQVISVGDGSGASQYISASWFKPNSKSGVNSSQGSVISYGKGGVYQFDHIAVAPPISDCALGLFVFESGGTGNSAVPHLFHNTVANATCTLSSEPDYQLGEGSSGSGLGVTNAILRDSIGTVGYTGVQSGNSDSSAADPQGPGSVGVWSNDIYGAGTAYSLAGTGFGSHPVTGDLSADPKYVAPSRDVCAFDAVLGGPGTCADLDALMAGRANTSTCTICGTYYDGAVGSYGDDVITYMRKWLQAGLRPTNLALWHSGSGVACPSVTGATNTTPIVITCSVPDALADGTQIRVASVGGNTNANGTWYVKVTGNTTFALYKDAQLQTAVAGNAAYTSGGVVTVVGDTQGAVPMHPFQPSFGWISQ